MKHKFYILIACMVLWNSFLMAQTYQLKSPDENLVITISAANGLSWKADYKGSRVIDKVGIALNLENGIALGGPSGKYKETIIDVKNEITVPVPNKDRQILDECRELRLESADGYSIFFRAYNEGMAYQFVSDMEGEVRVSSEKMAVSFPSGTSSLFPKEESMYSHFERIYLPVDVDDLEIGDFCSLPVLFQTKRKVNILFTEAGLHDYPAMFLESDGKGLMHSKFPNYVLKARPNYNNSPDRNEIIEEEAGYIARSEGRRTYPWRVFIISDDDRALVESNLVYQLSRPAAIDNIEWIKPGKVAWDWYNANNIFGVDFKSGLNTETYKYYIDFASENGIEYVILDEGWTKSTTEILDCNPDINLPELIRYAKSKNVGIILWVLWKPLDENMEEILDTYAKWGACGIKVDFMQRADQYMVSSYAAIAREAAKRKLLVDFHGAFKPAGLRREYPNVLSYEGVKGNENNKWSRDITPEHTVTLPFIRMVAGPMDFTPGSMRNYSENNFSISFERPMSMGTRCHQVAMYVVYESPIQMLCENPSIYRKEKETVDFIVQIPTVWDETRVLEAAVADYIVVARRSGDNWYLGAMTDGTGREFEIDFSFLPEGEYNIEMMQDGINADRYAEDYKRVVSTVSNQTKLSIKLVSGGGWAAIIKKI